jgi:hypothetical protein
MPAEGGRAHSSTPEPGLLQQGEDVNMAFRMLAVALAIALSSASLVGARHNPAAWEPTAARFLSIFPLAKLTASFQLDGDCCSLTTGYSQSVGIAPRGPVEVTIVDKQRDSPIAAITIGRYGTLYEPSYDHMPRFAHNTVGSRSYSSDVEGRSGRILGSQIHLSTRDRRWDVHIWLQRPSSLTSVTNLAAQIDRWLVDEHRPAGP